ncbi:Drug/Metabolite Transporter (DMT) Superfamily [Phytophthora infestans T30-4]|uniref:Drug/Metabolite Transporter (DMT) Superfamily n=1 Tax=Phytophthora infestans (strain T30-4) TaxID=403677 RepID=D0NAU7_PHYIT|nr:Drug/Metabolite Transporter (DMT) Superfamily [Phytophthora infestans T30-4]EEY54955.1 Drug/Metabolite Transporter (DMT) Superfamily [Phytophthora infestans T30-4]|eukprot:XP_002903900.1 Drug/Metabolite Transporter (DMT) Superfamily [Phytophthora infestans T30-4]
MSSHQDVAAPRWEEALADAHSPVRMSRRSGVVPVTKPVPNEHTKLLDEDIELEKETKKYFHTKHVGLLALLVVIWSTIFQAEAVQHLQTAVDFKKPFFVMCSSHAAPVLLLPFIFAYYRICGTTEDRHAGLDFAGVLQRHSIVPLKKLMRLSAFLGVFYLVADYFWFASLQNLTVAAGAAIFNSAPLFVYCFSICLLNEKVVAKKVFGVLLAFAGVTMVVLFQGGDDAGTGSPSVIGGLMMVISAVLNAGYNVSVALTAGAEINDTPTLMIMMGMSGAFAIPAWFVGTIFFAHSPFPSLYEPIGFPPTAEGNLMLVIAIVMFVTNFIFLTFAVCWTSPLETSVGFMLTIPLSGLMDTLMHSTTFTWECIIGSTLVMTGFLILELSSTHPPTHHSHEELTEKVQV